MRVFRQIIGVGVGAAITLGNAAQSASAQPPAQSQDSLAPSNQLVELGSNVRSTSNTAPESAKDPEQSIAPRQPPTLGSQSERISHQLPQPGLRLHQSLNRLLRLPHQLCLRAVQPLKEVWNRQTLSSLPQPSQQCSCAEFPGTNYPGHSERKFPPSDSERHFRHQASGFPGTQPESAAVSDKPGGCQDRANRVNYLAAGDRPRPPQQPSFANRPTASRTNQIRIARTASCSLSRPKFSNGRQPPNKCRRRNRIPAQQRQLNFQASRTGQPAEQALAKLRQQQSQQHFAVELQLRFVRRPAR